MTLIRKQLLTPHEALELSHRGFYLKLIAMMLNQNDLYEIYVKEN